MQHWDEMGYIRTWRLRIWQLKRELQKTKPHIQFANLFQETNICL